MCEIIAECAGIVGASRLKRVCKDMRTGSNEEGDAREDEGAGGGVA